MNVRVYPNGDLASIAAAVLIAGQVVDNPRSVLGLPPPRQRLLPTPLRCAALPAQWPPVLPI